MTWQTTGNMPTEFDPTTDRLLASLASLGVTDEELSEDQNFLVELMMQVGKAEGDKPDDDDFIAVMDCAYIGLVYHRHMPFIVDSGEKLTVPQMPGKGPNDYYSTLSALSNALVRSVPGLTKDGIKALAAGACMRALRWMNRDPEVMDLAKHFLAMTSLGYLIHTYIDELTEEV